MLKRWKHCGKMKKPQIQIGQWPKQQTLMQKALLEQLLDEGRSVKVCQTKRLERVQVIVKKSDSLVKTRPGHHGPANQSVQF